MERKYVVAAVCALTLARAAIAQPPPEEQCKKNVDASVAAIELMTRLRGVEQKLDDLSVRDIREIQKSRGHCAAQKEIDRRMGH